VTTTKRCRREWTTTHIKNSWKTYLHAMNVKKKVIVKKKKLKFRKAFQTLIDQTTSFWRLARWTKKKSHKSKKMFKVSDLIQKKLDETIIRTTIEFENKIDMLFTQFFSSTKHANLSNTREYRYLNVVIKTHENIIEEKIF
jgi:hypothetical protein